MGSSEWLGEVIVGLLFTIPPQRKQGEVDVEKYYTEANKTKLKKKEKT